MKRRYLAPGILLCLLLLSGVCAFAAEEETQELENEAGQEILESFDFTEINEELAALFPDQRMKFEDVVISLSEGDIDGFITNFIEYGKDQIFYEFRNSRKNLIYIIMIAIVAAVFSNFSNAFHSRQSSGLTFYILYMLLVTMCLQAFEIAYTGLEEKIGTVIDFMKLLCPSYFMAVVITKGSGSALMFYNMVLFLIYMAEAFILHFLLPVIHVYIMVKVMNYLTGEELFSELAQLIRKLITWTLKTMIGIVTGLNVIQGLLAPAADNAARGTLTKAVEAIPGIGNTFESVTDIILGAAVLIKNGIGVAGAVVLFAICLAPILQLVLSALLYKLAAALVQPVSDKRVTGCISSVSEGYELMLQVLVSTLILFLITIAVVAASTS